MATAQTTLTQAPSDSRNIAVASPAQQPRPADAEQRPGGGVAVAAGRQQQRRRRRRTPGSGPRSGPWCWSRRPAASSAETTATTATATDAAVTRRVPRAATVATAAGEATARPRRPRGRSRADQAVTARRSRSISSWSGTSIARPGHHPGGEHGADEQQRPGHGAARARAAPVTPVSGKIAPPGDHPDPQALLVRASPRARATPAVTAPASAVMPTTMGSRSSCGIPDARRTPPRRRTPARRARGGGRAGPPAARRRPRRARAGRRPPPPGRRRSDRAANQPASAATADGDREPERRSRDPAAPRTASAGGVASGDGSPAGPASGRHEQVAGVRCPTRRAPRRRAAAGPIRVHRAGTPSRPDCSAYSRGDVDRGGPARGTTRSSTPPGPWTLTARLLAAVPCPDATLWLPEPVPRVAARDVSAAVGRVVAR